MDTASNAINVAGISGSVSEEAVKATAKAPVRNQQVPQIPQEPQSDAVRVSIAAAKVAEAPMPEKAKADDVIEAKVFDIKEAKKAAESLEKTLNSIIGTEIRFNVSLAKGDDQGIPGQFKFQVVDKETGRVVRQFPPSEINEVESKALLKQAGILLDGTA